MRPTTINGYDINGQPGEIPLDQIKWRPAIYALIFNAAGELLVLDNTLNGKFDLPGGGLEIWETLEQGLIREVWEETGLEVKVQQLIHAENTFFISPSGRYWHVVKLFYTVQVIGGQLRNSILPDECSLNPHWIIPANYPAEQFSAGWEAIQKGIDATS